MSQLVSHKELVDSHYESYQLNPSLWDIVVPYKQKSQSRKRKRNADNVTTNSTSTSSSLQKPPIQLKFESFMASQTTLTIPDSDTRQDNKDALSFMDHVQGLPYPPQHFNGGNTNSSEVEFTLNGETFLVPKNCSFFNKNVLEIPDFLPLDNQFDFIVMDPPWWNKYIRRIKSVKEENGYKMLSNEDIQSLPIERLLSPTGLLVIWCTNSPSHKKAIKEEMLVKWGLKLITVWHWMKVTRKGDPICDFHPDTGKQPYELVFIAGREGVEYPDITRDHLVVSVPSVVHSHKFPIYDVLRPYLTRSPDDPPPNCLEIFARYLQPGFTSVGLEVLKLQNKKLFLNK